MQITLGVIIPVAVILVVGASTLAQGPLHTELLNGPPTLFLPLVTNNGSGTSGTSFELFEQALAGSEIDEETALVCKVFAVYLDPRPPQRFKGDDSQVRDTLIMGKVGARWLSLTPTTQALLAPFLLPPAAPGSWLELPRGQAATTRPEKNIEWVTLNRSGSKVKVWYQTHYPGNDVVVAQILADMEDIIWPKLFKLMDRAPLPDDGLPNNGGDGLFDIYLVRLAHHGEAPPYPPGCKKDPSYILVNGASNELHGTPVPTLWFNDEPCSCEELSSVQSWNGQVNFSFTTAASSAGDGISYNHSATVNLQMAPDYHNSAYVGWQDVSLGFAGEMNDIHTSSHHVETLVGSAALHPGGPTQDAPSASLGVWLSTCTFEFHLQTGTPAEHIIRDAIGETTWSVSTGVGFMDINDIPATQLTGSRTLPAVYFPIDEPSRFVPGGVVDVTGDGRYEHLAKIRQGRSDQDS